jgi:hypothetical protein
MSASRPGTQRRQSVALNNPPRLANDTTLANLSRRHPLLIVHTLACKRLQKPTEGVVASDLRPQLWVVVSCYANERLIATIKRRKEGRTDPMTVHRDDLLAREQIYRYADREFVFPT